MAYPAAMAVAVGEELGLSRQEIIRGVSAFRASGSRMRVLRFPATFPQVLEDLTFCL